MDECDFCGASIRNDQMGVCTDPSCQEDAGVQLIEVTMKAQEPSVNSNMRGRAA